MTRLHTGTVAHPRYQSRPYRPAPARREHIFGKVQGLPDRRDPTARIFIALGLIVALYFALQLTRLI